MKIFLEIFLKIFEKKILKNIFEKNIYKKYFQYPSVIPFWNRETQCYHMALLENGFDAFFFNIQRDPLVKKKSTMALVGHNLYRRTILQMQISFICMKAPRTEPVPPLDDYRPTLIEVNPR